MAEFRISIGTAVATREASDAKAQDVVLKYIRRRGGPQTGTAQERLDWVLNDLISRMIALARQQHIEDVERAARDQVNEADTGWSNT